MFSYDFHLRVIVHAGRTGQGAAPKRAAPEISIHERDTKPVRSFFSPRSALWFSLPSLEQEDPGCAKTNPCHDDAKSKPENRY